MKFSVAPVAGVSESMLNPSPGPDEVPIPQDEKVPPAGPFHPLTVTVPTPVSAS